ncbi:MAG TPA: UDP-N-acetylmuramate dehydrogenase [Thermodesulfovibrionales bacterium]|nr:UDP-N-acetylmuramate dehydrogenase [Thermodesulfovibrionales bacterium]
MKIQEIKDILSGSLFEGEVRFMEPMSGHTSLKIGGPAEIYAVPSDLPSAINLYLNLKKDDIPICPLGSGTNVLVRDGGIGGCVVSLRSFKKIELTKEDHETVLISVDAGVMLQRLLHYAKENGYSGIEGLAGIPGTIGGAIYGNAGAFGYQIGDVIQSVDVLDEKGNVSRIPSDEILFGYRKSGIRSGHLIISSELRLKKDRVEDVSKRADEFLNAKKETQPLWESSAGCVFKNPEGLAAGKLIDEAACKGLRVGDVEVSGIHANFFVNKGRAKATEFMKLMDVVSYRVKKKFGVVLEPEIRIIGIDESN